MARIQIITAVTIDGFLPKPDNQLMQWVKTDSNGFPYWHEYSIFQLYAHYPMLDLLAQMERNENYSDVYLAEISDKESIKLLQALSRYHLIDEMVVYILPLVIGSGISVFDNLAPSQWQIHKTKSFSNGICRIVYRKVNSST